MINRSAMKDVVGTSSLTIDYIYETADLSFLQPFYPEGEKRRAWTETKAMGLQNIGTRCIDNLTRLMWVVRGIIQSDGHCSFRIHGIENKPKKEDAGWLKCWKEKSRS